MPDKYELKIRPDASLLKRWDDFLWAEEARRKTRRLGNALLNQALTEFLDRAERPVPSAEQPPPDVSRDTLSGLPPEHRQIVEDLIGLLREGQEPYLGFVLNGIDIWKKAKGEGDQGVRRVKTPEEVPAAKRKHR